MPISTEPLSDPSAYLDPAQDELELLRMGLRLSFYEKLQWLEEAEWLSLQFARDRERKRQRAAGRSEAEYVDPEQFLEPHQHPLEAYLAHTILP